MKKPHKIGSVIERVAIIVRYFKARYAIIAVNSKLEIIKLAKINADISLLFNGSRKFIKATCPAIYACSHC